MATKVKNQNAISSKGKAIEQLRNVNLLVTSLNGCIKTIKDYWKDGYKEAFEYIGLEFKDITFEKMTALWSDKLKIDIDENGKKSKKLANYGLQSVVAKDKKGKPILDAKGKETYERDENGNIKKEKVLKVCKNFTVMKLFNAVMDGQIERGVIQIGTFGAKKSEKKADTKPKTDAKTEEKINQAA